MWLIGLVLLLGILALILVAWLAQIDREQKNRRDRQ